MSKTKMQNILQSIARQALIAQELLEKDDLDNLHSLLDNMRDNASQLENEVLGWIEQLNAAYIEKRISKGR